MCGGTLSIGVGRTKGLPEVAGEACPVQDDLQDLVTCSGPGIALTHSALPVAPEQLLQRQSQVPSWQAAAAKLAAADHTQAWAPQPHVESSTSSSSSDAAPPYQGQWCGTAAMQLSPVPAAATATPAAPRWRETAHHAFDVPAHKGSLGAATASTTAAPQPHISSNLESALDRLRELGSLGAADLWPPSPPKQHHMLAAHAVNACPTRDGAQTSMFSLGAEGHRLPQATGGDGKHARYMQYMQYAHGAAFTATTATAPAYASCYPAAEIMDSLAPAAGRAFHDGYKVQNGRAQVQDGPASLQRLLPLVPHEGHGSRGMNGTPTAWHPSLAGAGMSGGHGHLDAAPIGPRVSMGAACGHGGQAGYGSRTGASSPSSPSTGSARSTGCGSEPAAAAARSHAGNSGGSRDLAAGMLEYGADLCDLLGDGYGEVSEAWVPPAGCDPDAIKLFVGHIPKTMTEAQLRMQLELVGKVVELEMKRSRFNHIAFCWYASRESAERALLHFKAMRHVMRGLSERGNAGSMPLVVRRAKAQAPKAAPAPARADVRPYLPAGTSATVLDAASDYLECIQLLRRSRTSLEGEQVHAEDDVQQAMFQRSSPHMHASDLHGPGVSALSSCAQGLRRGLSDLPGGSHPGPADHQQLHWGSVAQASGTRKPQPHHDQQGAAAALASPAAAGLSQACGSASVAAASVQLAAAAEVVLQLPVAPQHLATLSTHVQQMVAIMSGARITLQLQPQPGSETGPGEHPSQLIVCGTSIQVEAAKSMIGMMVGI